MFYYVDSACGPPSGESTVISNDYKIMCKNEKYCEIIHRYYYNIFSFDVALFGLPEVKTIKCESNFFLSWILSEKETRIYVSKQQRSLEATKNAVHLYLSRHSANYNKLVKSH